MNTVAWMFLVLLIGGLAYVMVFRVRTRAGKRKRMNRHLTSLSEMSKPPLRVYKYHAVELRLCDDPCESALAIAGKRLLKSEAPALPLTGCHHKKCMCAYIQYDDRRFVQRRVESSPYGRPTGGRLREERRREERRRAAWDRHGRSPR
ncbi:MAG: hypothetical protein FWG26_02405 [Betaproteobacteria bacterium]|jgi:hypothetical protein|nr:hypothetical protein [Betaproteobacteria bacterium]